MNNIFENEKETLRKINTSISINDYSKNDPAPDFIRAALNNFDKSINPFIDSETKEKYIDKLSNLEERDARLGINYSKNSSTIDISSIDGIVKYSYNPTEVSFSLKTDLYEVEHRYKKKADDRTSGESLYIKTDSNEFEYNLTSGMIYRDSNGNVRSATKKDLANIYMKIFYFIDKADSIVFDNLEEHKVKEKVGTKHE